MSGPPLSNDLPKISIVTPSFNQASYLRETLESIHSQDYPNLEHIVVDGGSTDDSVAIIKAYEAKLDYWVSEPDRGQSHAINKGFARSTGDILGWLNSDDLLLPNALGFVAERFASHPDREWMIGATKVFGSRIRYPLIRYPNRVDPNSLVCWMEDKWFPQQSTFWRRDLWNRCGPLDESLHYLMDWELWLRFYNASPQPLIVRQVLSGYRFHDAAKCSNIKKVLAEELVVHQRILSQGRSRYREHSAQRMTRI